ncbi:unnamed protein product [Lactuca saligna]|uniref:Retrovirus-related Pol polyprotein from transposon TNT 1-94-like beta-barrel domain-containing protein n=1 Tax=Lactuca saligna TaxID=75948 RepID=A0AA36E9I1_LACSI|nr:unnamed protein product [Lactuca saligna]
MISSLTRAIRAGGWFVDTGTTVHICGQRESFYTYRPMLHRMVVICADSHRAEVQGRGDGLVSTDKFDKGGFKMVLEKCKITITKRRRYVGKANSCSGMYCLCLSDEGSVSDPSVESSVASVTSVSSVTSNDVIGELLRPTIVAGKLDSYSTPGKGELF